MITPSDTFTELETIVRGRMHGALRDKAAFERDHQRLNSQLMQGELNMGAAVLVWIERQRGDAAASPDDDAEDATELS